MATAEGRLREPSIWEINVKAGDVFEVTLEGATPMSSIAIIEKTDVSKYDLAKPESNPFFPRPANVGDEKRHAGAQLQARARDGRVNVQRMWRDATLLVATRAIGPARTYRINVRPAPQPLLTGQPVPGRLTIGSTDYWAFDADVGDVMNFSSSATGFATHVSVLDPDLVEITSIDAQADQIDLAWDFIAKKKGKYLVAMSSIGDGGGGDYLLGRRQFPPRVFGLGSPAAGILASGDVHVWKLTVRQGEPLLMRWHAPGGNYSHEIRAEGVSRKPFPLFTTDADTFHSILSVLEPTTYVIVLRGGTAPTTYRIDVTKLD
jgi:hypothetical protein